MAVRGWRVEPVALILPLPPPPLQSVDFLPEISAGALKLVASSNPAAFRRAVNPVVNAPGGPPTRLNHEQRARLLAMLGWDIEVRTCGECWLKVWVVVDWESVYCRLMPRVRTKGRGEVLLRFGLSWNATSSPRRPMQMYA